MKAFLAGLALLGGMAWTAYGQQPGQNPRGATSAQAPAPQQGQRPGDLDAATRQAQDAALEAKYWALQASRYSQTDPQSGRWQHAATERANRRARLEARRWMGQSAARPNVNVRKDYLSIPDHFLYFYPNSPLAGHWHAHGHAPYFAGRGYETAHVAPIRRARHFSYWD